MTQRDLQMMELAAKYESEGMSHREACERAFDDMRPVEDINE